MEGNETGTVSTENVTEVEPQLSTETEAPQDPAPQETAKEKAARIKRFKSAGQEMEFNLDDDKSVEELIKLAQLGGGARLSMQEKAELKKQQDRLSKLGKENPKELLKEFGHDPEALAEAILQAKIDELAKSPEQKKQEELQAKYEEAVKKLQEAENQKEAETMNRLQIEAAQSLNQEIVEALEANPVLPKSQLTVKRIAEGLSWAIENGFPQATVKDIIPFVKKEMQKEFQQHVEALPEEFIEEFFGQQIMERLRQSRLKKHKEIKATQTPVPQDDTPAPTTKKSQSFKSFFGPGF
jgi:hypothetical protein